MMAILFDMIQIKVDGRFNSHGVPRVGSLLMYRTALPFIAVGSWVRPGAESWVSRDALCAHAISALKVQKPIKCASHTFENTAVRWRNRRWKQREAVDVQVVRGSS